MESSCSKKRGGVAIVVVEAMDVESQRSSGHSISVAAYGSIAKVRGMHTLPHLKVATRVFARAVSGISCASCHVDLERHAVCVAVSGWQPAAGTQRSRITEGNPTLSFFFTKDAQLRIAVA